MKKKSVLIRNPFFADTMKTIDYLKQEGRYPVQWMLSFLDNQFYIPGMHQASEIQADQCQAMGQESGTRQTPCNSLEIFCKSYSRIYIYGAGVCGKNLALYFSRKGWEYEGLIVTSASDATGGAITLAQAKIGADTGIVISVLNKETAQAIAEHTDKVCGREQLFFISDCSAIKIPV